MGSYEGTLSRMTEQRLSLSCETINEQVASASLREGSCPMLILPTP